jgi:hypothetical protein
MLSAISAIGGSRRLFLGGIIYPDNHAQLGVASSNLPFLLGCVCFEQGIADSDLIPGSVTRQASGFTAGRSAVFTWPLSVHQIAPYHSAPLIIHHAFYLSFFFCFAFVTWDLEDGLWGGSSIRGRNTHERKNSNNPD